MVANSPRFDAAPVLWTVLCLLGAGLGVDGVITTRPGSEPWQVGLLAVAVFAAGWLALVVWWLVSQREIRANSHIVLVRSWLEILFGRRGAVIPIASIRRAGVVMSSGRKLEIETPSRTYRFWVALWPDRELTTIREEFTRLGIAFRE